MSNYKILQFKNNLGQELNWTGDNAGMFINTNNDLYHIFYLLNKPRSFRISKIKRISDNIIFELLITRINNNQLVNNFTVIENGKIYLNNIYSLDAINVYQPPVPNPPPAPVAQTSNNFTTLETQILNTYENTGKIRIQGLLKKHAGYNGRKETPKEFLIKFFKEWNLEKNTLFIETSEIQTVAGRRRSLGDIFMIMKYYYPTITLKEVCKLLIIEIPSVITQGFRTSYCTNINKRVWYYSEGLPNLIGSEIRNDEYGNIYNTYKMWLNE